MVYQIEVALDVRKNINISHQKDIMIRNAEKNECLKHYESYEMSGAGRRITRSHNILTFIFPENEYNIIKFIRFVKRQTSGFIEQIGYDNCIYEIIYVSKKYCSFMTTASMRDYIKKKPYLLNKYRNILNVLKCR